MNTDASFGELAWIWGKGRAADGVTWARRLWFSGGELVAWGWAYLPHQVRRSDGSVRDVTGAYLGYQVDPGHAALTDEVISWYGTVAAGLERTVAPGAADEAGLARWAAHGYQADPASLGDTGSWSQLNERDLAGVEQPVLPDGYRFLTADEDRRVRAGRDASGLPAARTRHSHAPARDAPGAGGRGHAHDGRLPGGAGASGRARAVLRRRVPAAQPGRTAHQACRLDE